MKVLVQRLQQVPIRPKGNSETFFPFEVVVGTMPDEFVREIKMISPTVPIITKDEIRQSSDVARKTFYVPQSTPVTVTVTAADGTSQNYPFTLQITDNDLFLDSFGSGMTHGISPLNG